MESHVKLQPPREKRLNSNLDIWLFIQKELLQAHLETQQRKFCSYFPYLATIEWTILDMTERLNLSGLKHLPEIPTMNHLPSDKAIFENPIVVQRMGNSGI